LNFMPPTLPPSQPARDAHVAYRAAALKKTGSYSVPSSLGGFLSSWGGRGFR
jgi:hypothetical protein